MGIKRNNRRSYILWDGIMNGGISSSKGERYRYRKYKKRVKEREERSP